MAKLLIRNIRNVGQSPHDYVRELLAHKNFRKIGTHGSLIVNDDDSVSVWLHNTEIVRAYRSGKTILRNGGWQTVTTKRYINMFLPSAHISQTNYVWNVWGRASDFLVTSNHLYEKMGEFVDGCILSFDGGHIRNYVKAGPSPFLMRKIHAFATRYAFSGFDTVDDYVSSLDRDSLEQWDATVWDTAPAEARTMADAMREAVSTAQTA